MFYFVCFRVTWKIGGIAMSIGNGAARVDLIFCSGVFLIANISMIATTELLAAIERSISLQNIVM